MSKNGADIPVRHLFNAANSALRQARYMARNESYTLAAEEVAAAAVLVLVLQIGDPPMMVEVPSQSMKVPMDSYSGVAIRFKYQMLRWSVTADDLDDGLYDEED